MIAAVASPPGRGAISLLRVSGPGALAVAAQVFRASQPAAAWAPRRVLRVRAWDGQRELDDGLLTFFRAPKSYTGEELVEFTGHGGELVTERVLEALFRAGARPAAPGEFTERAFLNGKLDLTQAEGIMDLIGAQTDLALRAAAAQKEGRLSERLLELRGELLSLLSHIEAYIDFPDEDIDPETGQQLRVRLERLEARVGGLLATAEEGRILREGARVVLCGQPNAGKSSLLNRLLGFERAIVNEAAGTTRDTVEEVVNFQGVPVRLIDTAGLRETADPVEQAGVERTREAIAQADLALGIIDGSAQEAEAALVEEAIGAASKALLVLNKVDLGLLGSWEGREAVRLSCETGEGVEDLARVIAYLLVDREELRAEGFVAINLRHRRALEQAERALSAALAKLAQGESPEFLALELREAMEAVGEVVGQLDAEELLGEIFGSFCIGK
ncbi:MAG: tRNA uridine-5-carboxymethylaminomethyl(34) synthesis GTPase MnmE [Verrucomicrobiota bacterium]